MYRVYIVALVPVVNFCQLVLQTSKLTRHALANCKRVRCYGTAQRQLDSRGYFTRMILSCCTHPLLRVHAYTHAKV